MWVSLCFRLTVRPKIYTSWDVFHYFSSICKQRSLMEDITDHKTIKLNHHTKKTRHPMPKKKKAVCGILLVTMWKVLHWGINEKVRPHGFGLFGFRLLSDALPSESGKIISARGLRSCLSFVFVPLLHKKWMFPAAQKLLLYVYNRFNSVLQYLYH